jgi:hypothetical protein
MQKSKAIELLGGTPTAAATACRITASAVSQWPEELTQAIENTVLAALARRHLPPGLLGVEGAPSEPTEEARDAA